MNLARLEDDMMRQERYGPLGQLPLLKASIPKATTNMIVTLTVLAVLGAGAFYVLSRKRKGAM
jgi:hypothetical protein